ncbi:MAG: SDR family NAD(P)-dependent oxidoreductase [Candidatus Hodarchaeota archaeon]
MKNLLDGKYALITGGGRGIGKAVALEYARNGANVAITALEENELLRVVDDIKKYDVESIAIPADLTNIEEIKSVVEEYFKNFKRCDILVNNAGMSYYCPILEVSLEKAVKLFKLNLIAYYAMIKLILPKMVEQEKGNIIMTASVHGNMFFNPNQVAYSSAKAGVSAMGKCLHNELNPFNIQVNVVLPGAIQTKLYEDSAERGQITPESISPEEIALIYLFLASDLSFKRYKGKIINQMLLFDLLPKIKNEVNYKDFNIKEITKSMKTTLRKGEYSLLRKNQELIDFLIRY